MSTLPIRHCIALLALLALVTPGCSTSPRPDLTDTSVPSPVPTQATATPVAQPSSAPTPAARDSFQRGLERAYSAAVLSQSAESQDDWRLVAGRWQAAIDWMAKVPPGSPDYARAQTKIQEYRRNLAIARNQANRSVPTAPTAVVLVPPVAPAQPSPSPRPVPQRAPSAAQGPRLVNPPVPVGGAAAAPAASGPTVVQVPIVRRSGGTPIIAVTFNGNQVYEMIVDTGASGTLITPAMARALGVVPVGQARVSTASADNVVFPLGYVRSIAVGELSARNVLVAVAGPELDVGLLGHDFFGDYDLTIRQNVVEFRHR